MKKSNPDKYTALFNRVRVLKKLPPGWHFNEEACTAPPGYVWANNHKPLFSSEYEHALIELPHNGKKKVAPKTPGTSK